MSDGIKLKTGIQAQTVVQNSDLPFAPSVQPPQNSSTAASNENGGVYFELSWQNGRGKERKQDLLTAINGENPSEPISYRRNSVNKQLDWKELPLDEFVDLVENNRDFAEFRDQPREFWRDVRRFSETKNITADKDFLDAFDDTAQTFERKEEKLKFFDEQKAHAKVFESKKDAIKIFDENNENTAKIFDKKLEKDVSPNISRYEKLVAEMNAKQLLPDEFAETLPPKEREIFKARYQLDATFGAKTLTGDDVNTVQNGQFHSREIAVQNNVETAALPKEIHFFSHEGKIAPLENTPTLTSREIAVGAKNVAPFSANTFIDSESKIIESNDSKFQDKFSQVAVGGSANSITTESGAARVICYNAISENSSNIAAVARRDGGAAMGGALISGAFASIENYKNAESREIGGSSSVGNADIFGRSVFSAGATGVMMSAAIGSVIPNADASVGGVLGFISGIVVGVETEQGLRWLDGDRPTIVLLPNKAENSLAVNLSLQPFLA